MNENAISPEVQKAQLAQQNATARLFESEDGKIFYQKLLDYRQNFMNSALLEKERDNRVSLLDMASGVDGVLWLIDRAKEAAKRREEEAKAKEKK